MLHVAPSQCMVNVVDRVLPRVKPTAHTSPPDSALTARSSLESGTAAGSGTTTQCVPSHRMMSVLYTPLLAYRPTAHTSLEPTASTPNSVSPPDPAPGVGTILHWVPSQWRASEPCA